MNKKLKKTLSFVSAAVMAAATFSAVPQSAIAAGSDEIIFQAECETLDGATLWTSIYEKQLPGYSGDGFAYLTSDPIKFEVEAPEEGIYDISVRCAQILSEEGRMQTISINDVDFTYNLPYIDAWRDVSFGVFRLKKGTNTIVLKPQYGYASYDTITVSKAEIAELKGSDTPCDPAATSETKSLMKYLNSVYGKNVLSGQQEIYGGGHGVQTNIRYDASTGKCIDSSGKVYDTRDEVPDTADDGSTFVWHCWDENGQEYTYDTQNRSYKYNEYDREIKYLKDLTGDAPAIRGFDFGSNCPCYCWDDGVTGRMIDWAKNQNGICTASWHINVPTSMADYTLGEPLDFSKTTYSEKTDFKTANVMVEGTTEYEYFKLAMDNMAKQFLELQEAGVPVIWRPFHEAEGNGGADGKGAWFWWSKEGTEVYKELWKYMYKTFTEDYGIHNLIWEQNLYAWSEESGKWYVGDDYVDIVGFDKYDTQYNRHDGKTSGPNEDANSKVFWSLVDFVGNNKMVAMPENSTIPSVENMLIEHANWLYFCTWYDEESSPKFISGEDYNNADTVKATYQSDYCITLSELPEDLYTSIGGGEQPTTKPVTTTTPVVTTTTNEKPDAVTTTTTAVTTPDVTTTTTEEPTTEVPPINIVYGDTDGNGKVEIADAVAVMSYVANKAVYPLDEEQLDRADVSTRGDGISNLDALSIQKHLAQVVTELPESYMEIE